MIPERNRITPFKEGKTRDFLNDFGVRSGLILVLLAVQVLFLFMYFSLVLSFSAAYLWWSCNLYCFYGVIFAEQSDESYG